MINFTPEQQAVIDAVSSPKPPSLVLIDSVAGSGKTTLLTGIAEQFPKGKGLYLAYNKSIATSSKKKFPSNIYCCTTHSLAYRAVVKQEGLKVGFFTVNQIKERSMPTKDKYMLVEDIREFCLSSYVCYKEFAADTGKHNVALAEKYLDLMASGKIECTHEFYLKLFHIMLHDGDIDASEYDLIMLDEAGDLNEVTLEMFKLLPAKVKVAVGDPHQNIYTFNHTINCFDKLSDQGTTFKLPKSFRVPSKLAKPIKKYCNKHLDPDMEFIGIDTDKKIPTTEAFISRTNSGIINKIIQLDQRNIEFSLVRPIKEIFKIPLMVAGFKYQGKIYDTAYKHLQDDIDEFYEKHSAGNLLTELMSKYSDDVALISAIKLVMNHGKSTIFDVYNRHKDKKHDQGIALLTAHSSKGLEFDSVELADNMNETVGQTIQNIAESGVTEDEDRENLNLYYVACTRALVILKNAKLLEY